MSLTMPEAKALGDYLAGLHSASIFSSDDPIVAFGYAVRDFTVAFLPPETRPVTDALIARGEGVSVTLPTPFGTMEVLSASADGDEYAEKSAHEAVHAFQIQDRGGLALARDYVGSAQNRARFEGHAYTVGKFVRFLVTGVLPNVEDAMASVDGGLYHLGADESHLARAIIESGIRSMRIGATPPYHVAVEALAWLRKNAPDAILAEKYRAGL